MSFSLNDTLPLTLQGLPLPSLADSGVPYRVYVAAVNSAGEGEWRATEYVFTEELRECS